MSLETTIYQKLINYRNEADMQYQKMRERQLSEEQEKRLEEEIMRKLSTINMVLNKAKEKIQIMGHDEQQEEVKGLAKDKNKDESSEAKLDLHRVFVDDNDNKTKSQAISKWKDIKKDGRAKIKELEKQEEALRLRVERRAKKFGVMAKNARIKGD
jgi:homoserine trans-succinylase